jgi:hypothetical protein
VLFLQSLQAHVGSGFVVCHIPAAVSLRTLDWIKAPEKNEGANPQEQLGRCLRPALGMSPEINPDKSFEELKNLNITSWISYRNISNRLQLWFVQYMHWFTFCPQELLKSIILGRCIGRY